MNPNDPTHLLSECRAANLKLLARIDELETTLETSAHMTKLISKRMLRLSSDVKMLIPLAFFPRPPVVTYDGRN